MNGDYVFNCLLVGKDSMGKRSFLHHHVSREQSKEQCKPHGVGVIMRPLVIHGSKGTIQFNIWDVEGMQGRCLVPTDCAIVFEDITTFVALKSSPSWHTALLVVVENIKVTAFYVDKPCSSFGDITNLRASNAFKRTMKLKYYNYLNLESPHNIEKIFLWLSRKLLNDNRLVFFSYPMFLPRFFAKAQKPEGILEIDCTLVNNSVQETASPTSSSSNSARDDEENTINETELKEKENITT